MKNGNMPAMPTEIEDNGCKWYSQGMTKREMIAMHALSGLIVKDGVNANLRGSLLAEKAVKQADELLKELEKQQ